jgi:hypothetical protein
VGPVSEYEQVYFDARWGPTLLGASRFSLLANGLGTSALLWYTFRIRGPGYLPRLALGHSRSLSSVRIS